MRAVTNVLAATALGLGLSLTLLGCEGALSPEAEAGELAQLEAIQASVNLSGTWVLNEEESDKPGPQGRGGLPGGPPDPPMGEGGPMAAERLTIEQLDGNVRLTDGSGRSRTLHPNGEWTTVGGESGTLQVWAVWKEAALRVVIRSDRGELSRTYELGGDEDQLLITSRMEDGPLGRTVELTRVYDWAATG